MKIVTRAPYRIEFAGGGTDLPEYYGEHTGFVFSAAIKKYVTCTLTTREDDEITSNFPYIKECADHYGIKGVDVQLEYDVPHGSGLGGSSSSFVAICAAMVIYTSTPRNRNLKHERKRIAYASIRLEREICNMPGGIQDQVMATYGGFVSLSMYDSFYHVDKIVPSVPVLKELEKNLILLKIHGSRDGGKSINILKKQYGKDTTMRALNDLKIIAHRMPLQIINGELDEFSSGMLYAHNLKTSAYNAVNNQMEEVTDTLRRLGYKFRLEGAGHGGHILVWAEDSKRLPFPYATVEFDFEGVTCIDYNA